MNNTLARVAMALLIDYTSVYFINLTNDHYECYSTNQGYQRLELQASGEDFFADCQRDIRSVVWDEDWEMLSVALSKEELLRKFREDDKLSIVYRLMISGKPVYHTMRILHDATGEDDCMILGVLNVDEAVRTERANRTYNAIAKTLANRYATIYYVELDTNHYVEYSSSDDYKDLAVPSEGNDFFSESRKNAMRVIHPDDLDSLLNVFTKETIMSLTENGRSFFIEYRILMNGEHHHVRLMAVRTETGENLVIALENIDQETREKAELKEISEKNLVFSHIAESLANQYGMIYYIDTETDEYIEFNAASEYRDFNIAPTGSDFFGTSQRNISMLVHAADRERVFEAMNKKTMLQALKEKGTFSMTYRLMMADGDRYTRMTVFWANDRKHLIMGIMNIDEEIQRENTLKKTLAENAIFSQIAESLANQYDTIYYVDMLTDHYMEFSSTDVYKSLEVRPAGDNFFSESVLNISRVIYPEDRDDIARLLNKPTLIQMLQGKHMLTHTYRLMIGSGVMYARMSVIWATDNKHLIIGVMNIDKEIRREQEVQEKLQVANEKAYRDELTGVKNKGAYQETEARLDALIASGSAKGFAVVVCDVNGLKQVNDRLGHIEGDTYIRSACDLICHTWSHSPVFRVGGDEFTVVLQGPDYEHRYSLLEQLRQQVWENKRRHRVIVASGMAEFRPGEDKAVRDVFERADILMYQNKAILKAEE